MVVYFFDSSAIVKRSLVGLSRWRTLNTAALAEGLAVDDPNTHP